MCFSSTLEILKSSKRTIPSRFVHPCFIYKSTFPSFTFLVPVLRFHTPNHRPIGTFHVPSRVMRPEVYSPLHSKLKATLVHRLRALETEPIDDQMAGRSSPPTTYLLPSETYHTPKDSEWMILIYDINDIHYYHHTLVSLDSWDPLVKGIVTFRYCLESQSTKFQTTNLPLDCLDFGWSGPCTIHGTNTFTDM